MGKIVISILLIFPIHWVHSQVPNELDFLFGDSGRIEVDIDDYDYLTKIEVVDSMIYFGGYSGHFDGDLHYDAIIGRVDFEGNLDTSFNEVGFVRFDFLENNHTVINDIAIGDSGIYCIGNSMVFGSPDTLHLFLGKYDFNGSLDTAFADSGFFTPSLAGTYDIGNDLEVLSGEKILFCGASGNTALQLDLPLMGRLLSTGDPDTTFGSTGIRIWNSDGSISDGIAPQLLEKHGAGGYLTELTLINGNYFFSGYYTADFTPMCMMIMMDDVGNLIPGFGGQGYRIFEIAPNFTNNIVSTIYRDGNIYSLIGVKGNFEGNIVLYRQDTLGVGQSTTSLNLPNYMVESKSMAITPNGSLSVSGYIKHTNSTNNFSDHVFLVEMDENGDYNSSYCNSGMFMDSIFYEERGVDDQCYYEGSLFAGGFVKNMEGSNVFDFSFLKLNFNPSLMVAELEQPEITIYPNPFIDQITLDLQGVEVENIEIINAFGQVIKRVDNLSNQCEIEMSEYDSGLYFIKFANRETNAQSIKQLIKL